MTNSNETLIQSKMKNQIYYIVYYKYIIFKKTNYYFYVLKNINIIKKKVKPKIK